MSDDIHKDTVASSTSQQGDNLEDIAVPSASAQEQDASVEVDLNESDGISASGPTRRSFIAGGVFTAAMLAVGGVSVAWANETELLRPPGAQDEESFLGACIRCDRCRSACPQNAISVAHMEDGIINIRTPKMNYKLGACDFCGGEFLCAVNCPTQAISFGFDPSKDMIGVAKVDYEECLLYRSNSHLCSRQCVSACPYDAVIYDPNDNSLSVNVELCNGCGICEYVCPSASYGTYTSSGKRGINVESFSD